MNELPGTLCPYCWQAFLYACWDGAKEYIDQTFSLFPVLFG
jgi:hypothetical protein